MNAKLSISEFHQTATYTALTIQQRRLVDAYLTNGNDRIAAVHTAFRCKENSARVMSHRYFSNGNIIAALAVANGSDPDRAQFEIALARAIKNTKTTRNQISALRLWAETKGYFLSLSETPKGDDTRFAVGDRVTQRDDTGVVHVGIIRALNAAGVPSEIEEVK
jgi:hypothetical protein